MATEARPSLDVRLTRSQSGSILDIDFVGALGLDGGQAAAAASSSKMAIGHVTSAPANSSVTTALVPTGRRLKILEHRVHKVENRVKENGEQEEELVVSNLRPFTVKVGVHDHLDQPLYDCNLPLRATLLYENGLPVKQTSTSEPLLVGETDVVALQGSAIFKLRITSLSSHRDKQRFRIQIAPQDVELQLSETNLSVVTDPMKSVTKLGRASHAAAAAPPLPLPLNGAGVGNGGVGGDETLKRKYRDTLEDHATQLQTLQQTQQAILGEMQALTRLVQQSLKRQA